MRLSKLQVRILLLSALVIAGSSCQTAEKPASLLPSRTAPSAPMAPAVSATPSQQVVQSPAPQAEQPPQGASVAAEAEPKAQESQKTASDQNVEELVNKAEKEYQAGLDAYNAGNIDIANQHFDSAVNALLDSNLDIRSDDRLEKEFSRIVEGIDGLDLGQTAESEAQKSEPAPIDETNGITPSADPNVKAKAQAEIKSTHSDLPLMMTDQVAGYISYFSNRGRGIFERAFARSGRYRAMMLPILKQEGVPQDLIYLAQAESGFHPLAVSRAGARGIWQFMGSRARGYGLQRNLWVDDRQDPVKSTRAAARHLKDLYGQFGDWYLAMAAYNSGPGTVQAAVRRTGYADFWELYRRNVLPKETRNYVPIILAVTIMTKNLSQYGFDDVSLDEPLSYDTETIDYAVDLRLVAQCVDATTAELQELNPSLLRFTTPKEGKFELHLPVGTKVRYETAIASIPVDMRLWWRIHKVQPGDTVASLGRTYRVTAKSIITANQLDGTGLQSGSKIVIPLAAGKRAVSDGTTYARRITRYKVHKGDTVETVAENFGVSPQMVRRWNGLHSSSLNGRKVLYLHLPVTPSESVSAKSTTSTAANHSHKTVQGTVAKSSKAETELADESNPTKLLRHTVKSGETLYSIATAYKTTVAALKRTNGDIAVLHPGMILVIQTTH
jgi:membrane-bound lytic murein transglycosylase D